MNTFIKRGSSITVFYITALIFFGFLSWASDNYERVYNGFPEPVINHKIWLSTKNSAKWKSFRHF